MEAGPNVQRAGQVLLGCPDVGLMVIGDDCRRLGLGGRPGAPEAGLIAISLLVGAEFAVTNSIVLPELLWLLWVVVTSVYLTIRPPREAVRA